LHFSWLKRNEKDNGNKAQEEDTVKVEEELMKGADIIKLKFNLKRGIMRKDTHLEIHEWNKQECNTEPPLLKC
jgi:hypothetical protein